MRQIVLDTETTGIGAESGHRMIEIGCVELVDRRLTGNHFHVYLNPQRSIDEGAFRVHGISSEFLQDKPLFKDVLQEFLQFVEGSEVIIHNAPFDVGFLNAEFKHAKWSKPFSTYCQVVDTLVLAREKHHGQRNTLDALCKRYDVDHSNRQLHGALLDAELLAFVYLAMTGGQTNLFIEDEKVVNQVNAVSYASHDLLSSQSPVIAANAEETLRHNEFVQFLVKKARVDYWHDESSEGAE